MGRFFAMWSLFPVGYWLSWDRRLHGCLRKRQSDRACKAGRHPAMGRGCRCCQDGFCTNTMKAKEGCVTISKKTSAAPYQTAPPPIINFLLNTNSRNRSARPWAPGRARRIGTAPVRLASAPHVPQRRRVLAVVVRLRAEPVVHAFGSVALFARQHAAGLEPSTRRCQYPIKPNDTAICSTDNCWHRPLSFTLQNSNMLTENLNMLEFCKIDAEIVENQHTVGRHHTDATSLRNFCQQSSR